MKNIFAILALLLSVSLSAQKYVQVFSKEGGIQIGISLSDIAFIAPSNVDGGSVVVLGPNPRVINVTDTLSNIIDSSASMLVELTEVYNNAGAQRQIGVSRQHIKEVVPDGNSQTLLRLRSPFNSIKVVGAFSVIADSLAAEVGGGGGGAADGNGIYSGDGIVPTGTLASVTASGVTTAFATGVFPNFPDLYYDGTEKGLFISPDYYDDVVLVNELGFVSAGTTTSGIGAGSNSVLQVTTSEVRITQNSNSFSIYVGTGVPEGVVTASVGSIYIRTDGGANTTLYIKETGAGNTGWTAK